MRSEMMRRYQASSASCRGQNHISVGHVFLSFQSRHARSTEEYKMHSENHIDLEIALRKIHELAMAEGDLGYAYWYEVGRLLQRAANMQAEIALLCKELERCRATRTDSIRAVKQRQQSASKAR